MRRAHDPDRRHRALARLAPLCVYHHAGDVVALRGERIRRNVVADHHCLVYATPRCARVLAKKDSDGLPSTSARTSAAYSSPATDAPLLSRSSYAVRQ